MTDQNLAIKYRPRKFEELAGQKAVSALLRAMLFKETVPNVILLEGVKGSGKTTTARVLAAALNCEEINKPCGECASCETIFEGRSLAVREIDAASHGLVDDIRQLQDNMLYSVPGVKHVLIIDEAQGLSKAASNALLKTLEFPPDDTVFILITTESNKILPTVRSRCMSFLFKPIKVEDIYDRLIAVKNKEDFIIADTVIYQIALKAKGSLRDGLLSLDQLTRAGVGTIEQYEFIFGESSVGTSLVRSILSGRHVTAFMEVDKALAQLGNPNEVVDVLIEAVKDIVIIKSGGTTALQGEDLNALEELAGRVDVKKAVAALRALWDARIKIRGTSQSSSILYLLITAVMDCLAAPNYENDHKLTFDKIGSMLGERITG